MSETITHKLDCQSFREGCCGCCINTRLSGAKLTQMLQRNTDQFRAILKDGEVTLGKLVRWHWRCGGIWDHLLEVWLVIPTLTLSAWFWKFFMGCCPFAGFLQESPQRVGCLIHPKQTQGGKDWRRWAFPFVPTVRCKRKLRCGLLKSGDAKKYLKDTWEGVSRVASWTLRVGDNRGAVIAEYALVMAIVVIQIAIMCSPNGFVFNVIRTLYGRTIIVINMPWL